MILGVFESKSCCRTHPKKDYLGFFSGKIVEILRSKRICATNIDSPKLKWQAPPKRILGFLGKNMFCIAPPPSSYVL